jgi:hypothetical protein
MIEELKDLKDTYEIARNLIDKSKEPINELLPIKEFLSAISADSSIIKEKMSKDYKRYFFEDFTFGLIKRLTKERAKNEAVIFNSILFFEINVNL